MCLAPQWLLKGVKLSTGVMCKVCAQAFVINVCIYIKLETNVLVSIGDSCIWAKTEGFSAQNTSLNLEEESKMSCESGWAKAAYI